MSEFPFFLRLNIFYYMHIPHFAFPFVYCRPLGLFPAWGYGEYGDAAVNVGVQISLQDLALGSSMYIPRNGIADHMVILCLIFWRTAILFSYSYYFYQIRELRHPVRCLPQEKLLDWKRLSEVEWLAPGSTTGGDERVRSEQIQTQRPKALYLQAVPAAWEAWLSSFWEESHPLFPLPSLWGGSRGYGLYGDPQPCAPIICKVPNDSCDS